MSLSAAAMASAIEAQITAISGITITDTAELNAFCLALSTAIVAQIVANAVVPSGIAVTVNTTTGIGATTAPGTVT